MSSVNFLGTVARSLDEKLGERISVLDFGAVGDGVTNDAPAFVKAQAAAVLKGGCTIHVPGAPAGGYYKLGASVPITSTVPVTWQGDGRASKIVRAATLGAGVGLFDLQDARKVTFRGLLIDGAVTTPAGLLYTDFAIDPMHALLTLNTSFWLIE